MELKWLVSTIDENITSVNNRQTGISTALLKQSTKLRSPTKTYFAFFFFFFFP